MPTDWASHPACWLGAACAVRRSSGWVRVPVFTDPNSGRVDLLRERDRGAWRTIVTDVAHDTRGHAVRTLAMS